MADIIDIFSKKKVDQPRSTNYVERYKQCIKRVEENGQCDCDLCQDKKTIAVKLYKIVKYLAKDYTQKTGKELYLTDILEIVLAVVLKLKKQIK